MNDYSKGAAFMEGAFMPVHEARLPVTDWGLTHSDITYDVVPVWEGRFFRLPDYIQRFRKSIEALRLDIGQDDAEIAETLHKMVALSGLRYAYVSMVASRGQPLVPGTRDPRACANHFFAWCVPFVHVFQPDVVAQGARLFVPDDVRRIPEDSVNPRAKNYHWGDFTEGLFQAKEAGFDSVLLLDHDGNITEGPGFNVFMVKDGRVRTPSRHCLHGITRKSALEIADSLGFETDTSDISFESFMGADEVFATTSGGGPVGVTAVNERVFSNGATGPVSQKIRDQYWAWMVDPAYSEAISYDASA